MPALVPGFRDVRINALTSSDVRRAKNLARGHTRAGTAVFYVPNFLQPLALAQLAKRQLAEIGLEVELRPVPFHVTNSGYLGPLGVPGEPWDIAIMLWTPDYIDPYAYVNRLLDARFIGGTNLGRFDSPKYNRLMRLAARLEGAARYERYGALDVELARKAAPLVPIEFFDEPTLVSKRVGCIVLRPALDLTAACLKPYARAPLRLSYRNPDTSGHDGDPGRLAADVDRLDLVGHRIDAPNGPVAGVRDPHRAGADGDGCGLVADGNRPDRVPVRVDPHDGVVAAVRDPDGSLPVRDPRRPVADGDRRRDRPLLEGRRVEALHRLPATVRDPDDPAPTAMPDGRTPAKVAPVRRTALGSTRASVESPYTAQTSPKPTATLPVDVPNAVLVTSIVSVTRPKVGSTLESWPRRPCATQTAS